LFSFVWKQSFSTKPNRAFTQIRVAILAALLGTHTFATALSAEEVAADPLVIERVLRGALSGVALLIIFPVLMKRIRDHQLRKHGILTVLTIYGLVAAASVLYSSAELVTAAKVFELSAGFAVAWAVALAPDPKKEALAGVRFIVLLEAALIVTSVIGFFLMPDIFSFFKNRPGFVFQETMISPFAHSNSLSASSALVAAYALATLLMEETRTNRRFWTILVGMGTIGVVLSSGRQGLAIWLVAIVAVLWVLRRRLFVLLIAPLSAAIVVLNWDPIWTSIQRDQPSASFATWSGRLTFWAQAIEVWKEHPWTGYGFGVGGRFAVLGGTISLHSGYFEALTGVGLLGVIPLLYVVARVAWWSGKSLLSGVLVRETVLFLPLVLHTLVSLGFAAWLKSDFFVFVFLIILADAATQERRTALRFREAPASVP
jgi:O-antigen ligase